MRTLVLVLLTISAAGAAEDYAPDGTPIACNFNLRLEDSRPGADPTGISTTCDGYTFNLFRHPYNPRTQSSYQIADRNSETPLKYLIADMPLDEPLLLLDANKMPTRIVARRRDNAIDFLVGKTAYKGSTERVLRSR